MLSVTFLGTSAARPTVERNVSAMALVREGETLLFECGEGTQRQMMRYGVSFALSEIFFTHFHADHFLGVIGLIRTLGLQTRTEPMVLYGPKGAKKVLGQAIQLGVERVPFGVDIREVKPGDVWGRGEGAGQGDGAFDGARGGAGRARRQGSAPGAVARFGALLDQCRRARERGTGGVQGDCCCEGRDDDRGTVRRLVRVRGTRYAVRGCRRCTARLSGGRSGIGSNRARRTAHPISLKPS